MAEGHGGERLSDSPGGVGAGHTGGPQLFGHDPADLVVVSAVVAIGLGPIAIPPSTAAGILRDHMIGSASAAGPQDFIVWNLRVPRVLQGLFVGAGLSVAGLLTQAMVRNPLGDPYILGLSSGAGLGAVLVLTTAGATVLGLLTLPLAAFGGAMVTALVVFALARTHGRLQPARMIMAGVAIGQLLSGAISFLLLRTRDIDAQQQVLFWLLGSLAGAQWPLALTCAALGALLLVWSDTAARLILAPSELPIGILPAAIGVPFFLIVLRRSAAGTVGLS